MTMDILQELTSLYSNKNAPGRHNQRSHAPKSTAAEFHRGDTVISKDGWYGEVIRATPSLVEVSWNVGGKGSYHIGDGYVLTKDQYEEQALQRVRRPRKNTPKQSEEARKPEIRPNPNEDLYAYIEYRKSIGADTKLSREEKEGLNTALDDIKPIHPIKDYSEVKESEFGKGYMVSGNGDLIDISGEFGRGTNDHPGYIAASSNPEMFGLSDKDANNFLVGYMAGESGALSSGWQKIFNSGAVRVREFKGSATIETQGIDDRTMHRLQRLYDDNKLDLNPKKNHSWGSPDGDFIEFSAADFLSAKHVNELRPRFKALKSLLLLAKKIYA